MFTRISALILAILMLVLLGSQSLASQANNPQRLYIVATCVVVLIFASLAINFKRLNFTWPHLLLPVIYLFAVGSTFIFISNSDVSLMFLVAAATIFYLLEIKLGRESHFLQNVYLLSCFALFLALFATQFYLNLRIWYVVPIAFILTYLLAIQGFAGFSLPSKKYFYLLLAIICGETTWGLSFWPTHFFVNAVVLFSFFYVMWLFSFSAFFGKLSRQKVYWQLSLIAIVLILTLSTAAWRTIK